MSKSNLAPALAITVLAAADYARNQFGGLVLGVKPYTNHPDDTFLAVVLYQNGQGQYVTHTYNHSCPSLNHGHYHEDDLTAALLDFNARGTVHQKEEPANNGALEFGCDVAEHFHRALEDPRRSYTYDESLSDDQSDCYVFEVTDEERASFGIKWSRAFLFVPVPGSGNTQVTAQAFRP